MEAELSPKVKALYQAVTELFEAGADLNALTVAEITGKAGIGKGTAYEYFSNKEEMIAGAIYQDVKTSCHILNERMCTAGSIQEKADILLGSMDEKLLRANGMFRALHVLMGNSLISQKLKEMFEDREKDDILIMEMVRNFVIGAVSGWDKIDENEIEYLSMQLFSKIICYAMCLCGVRGNLQMGNLEHTAMRSLLCRGICEDFERSREKLCR